MGRMKVKFTYKVEAEYEVSEEAYYEEMDKLTEKGIDVKDLSDAEKVEIFDDIAYSATKGIKLVSNIVADKA